MTIRNPTAHAQYETHATHGTIYARATDAGVQALMDAARAEGLRVPTGDQIENIVTEVFAMLWDFNNKDTSK